MEIIRPLSDLRNHYAEISKSYKQSKQPVYITVNGRGDTVLMGIMEYEQMKAELKLLHMLVESEEDVEKVRVSPIQNTFGSIRHSLAQENEG